MNKDYDIDEMALYKTPVTYGARIPDIEERSKSQSGGMFSVFAEYIIRKGGVVYGCILDDEFNAVHARAENNQEYTPMRNSKYIQSSTRRTFEEVYNDLKEGRIVLYTGTSCQIDGLRLYLQVRGVIPALLKKLYCVDIVCHGVPSPLVWQEYLAWEKQQTKQIINVKCRNKEFGWKSHVVTIDTEEGKKINSRIFPTIFYGHHILRPSCYKCPYKSVIHPSDITIADYWGLDKAAPDFNDHKGTSLVLINNDHGNALFENVADSLDIIKTEIEDSMQFPLKAPYRQPRNRNTFWEEFYSKDFNYIARKYGGYGLIGKFKKKIRAQIKKINKKMGKA